MADSHSPTSSAFSELLEKVLEGEARAVARAITLVENNQPSAYALMKGLFPRTGRSLNIGVTGAPGSGKSTLVDCLASHYRAQNKKIGIIAVDPTSPYTGGAILGDRIRMQSHGTDPHSFIRSMANRGHLGGLSRAAGDALLILDAAGFEVILIETVGVGQDEVEVARTVEVTVVLLVPGMGDEIQAMKAGIMEVADIFVINKADRLGADRVEAELQSILSLSERPSGWVPRIVRTVATENRGIIECAAAIEEFVLFSRSSKAIRSQKVQIEEDRLWELAGNYILEKIRDGPGALIAKTLAQKIAQRTLDPYSALEELLRSSRIDLEKRDD